MIISFTSQCTKKMKVQTDYATCPMLYSINGRIRTPKTNLIPNARILTPDLSLLCCSLHCETLYLSIHTAYTRTVY